MEQLKRQKGLHSMNKTDKKMILYICIVSLFVLFILFALDKKGKVAYVYYEDTLIQTIDLNGKQEYTVKGKLGDVHIQTDYGKIQVEKENSPKHLCSKQGWISSPYETIVCLPNHIIIKIRSEDEIDTIVK